MENNSWDWQHQQKQQQQRRQKEQQFVDLHFLCAAFLLWIITTYRLCLCFCRSRSHSRCSLCGQRALLLALSRSVARKCESRIAVAAAGEVLVRTLLSPHSHSPNPLRSLQQKQQQQEQQQRLWSRNEHINSRNCDYFGFIKRQVKQT